MALTCRVNFGKVPAPDKPETTSAPKVDKPITPVVLLIVNSSTPPTFGALTKLYWNEPSASVALMAAARSATGAAPWVSVTVVAAVESTGASLVPVMFTVIVPVPVPSLLVTVMLSLTFWPCVNSSWASLPV